MSVIEELQKLADPKRAEGSARYFKTGKGEYGEGDVFIGLTVPQVRTIGRKYANLPLADIEELLHGNIHEYRLTALIILTERCKKAPSEEQKSIVNFYLRNTKYINNWDLVDLSAPAIVGGWMIEHPKERKLLYALARSKNLWERRIAILATYTFIKQKDFTDTFAIAELLLKDKEDLIHKAVGWMLREVGKMDEAILIDFLKKHYKTMPRVSLRYAIERMNADERVVWLQTSKGKLK